MKGRYYDDETRLAPVLCPACRQRLDLRLANAGERDHATCSPEWRALQP